MLYPLRYVSWYLGILVSWYLGIWYLGIWYLGILVSCERYGSLGIGKWCVCPAVELTFCHDRLKEICPGQMGSEANS